MPWAPCLRAWARYASNVPLSKEPQIHFVNALHDCAELRPALPETVLTDGHCGNFCSRVGPLEMHMGSQ